MSTNPYEEASERRKPGRGRIWAAIIAMAALVTTVAWAAPQGGSKPAAELTAEETGHITAAGGQVTLTETLRFEEAQPDEEYVVSASLHLLGEDGADQGVLTRDGKAIEATANVRPVDDGRVLRLPITFDARGMEGKTIACFASLSKGDATIARWQDAKDESQIVRFPKLMGGFEGIDGGNEVLNEGTLRLRTRLSFENLIEGEDYRLNVVIVDASTGEPLRDGSGKEIGMMRKLAPTIAKGKESFTIEADGAPCAGKHIAMRANLSLGEEAIATYDGTKTGVLTVPKITSETGAATVDTDASKRRDVATIKETIRYEGLVPGTTYVLSGAVRDGEAGLALLDGDNNVVEGSETTAEFTPAEDSGTAELTHRIDVAALAGRDVVTCDILTRKADGRIVAEWDGVANGKTVLLASATSASVGTHTNMLCEPAWEQAGVTSVVSYKGLEAGKEYVAEGELRLLSENGSDGGVVTDAGGSPVKAHEAFVPTEAEGTVELRYELDATALEGKRLTARETVG
ncbi:MAG: VaFE repeat-containing surface-anchored protein, partial [Atopobiaceae bacterium]|nr:VaFE repeat-containing surface-anchored protein [Atopobiaceae bacterium]